MKSKMDMSEAELQWRMKLVKAESLRRKREDSHPYYYVDKSKTFAIRKQRKSFVIRQV